MMKLVCLFLLCASALAVSLTSACSGSDCKSCASVTGCAWSERQCVDLKTIKKDLIKRVVRAEECDDMIDDATKEFKQPLGYGTHAQSCAGGMDDCDYIIAPNDYTRDSSVETFITKSAKLTKSAPKSAKLTESAAKYPAKSAPKVRKSFIQMSQEPVCDASDCKSCAAKTGCAWSKKACSALSSIKDDLVKRAVRAEECDDMIDDATGPFKQPLGYGTHAQSCAGGMDDCDYIIAPNDYTPDASGSSRETLIAKSATASKIKVPLVQKKKSKPKAAITQVSQKKVKPIQYFDAMSQLASGKQSKSVSFLDEYETVAVHNAYDDLKLSEEDDDTIRAGAQAVLESAGKTLAKMDDSFTQLDIAKVVEAVR